VQSNNIRRSLNKEKNRDGYLFKNDLKKRDSQFNNILRKTNRGELGSVPRRGGTKMQGKGQLTFMGFVVDVISSLDCPIAAQNITGGQAELE